MRGRGIDRGLVAVIFGFFVCVGFALANGIYYSNHPHGRGECLFGCIWCTVMAAWVLFNIGRVAAINRSMTGAWWNGKW